MSDPFATAATRARVLAAWSASPARFREDANAEEDFALGGYRDRLVVELAQNAADAAARAGHPGVLRLTLRDDEPSRAESGGPVLVAENTGHPLTTEGVEALATLRASAKRTDEAEGGEGGEGAEGGATGGPVTVGRFGVGFAAVLAVTDEPTVLSRPGGVRFSRDDTAALVAEAGEAAPGLADEVRRRGGHVPVLRLPFEAEGEPPEGFDTAVVLPLRDEAAADLVRRLLAEADDALLLALPQLARIEIDPGSVTHDGRGGDWPDAERGVGRIRILTGVEDRWHTWRVGGTWTPAERAELLGDRPTEERDRPYWSVLWALPRQRDAISAGKPGVIHAPTPTDEPLSLPAMLLASFPLDPTRRHVATGPLTDRLVDKAAAAYAELVRQRAEAGDEVASLVPIGLPAGRLDGALRDAVLRRLRETPLLRPLQPAAGAVAEALLRPTEAVVIDGAEDDLVQILAPVVPGLVRFRRGDRAAYDALGVRRWTLSDLVDELAPIADAHPPVWWRELYLALAPSLVDPVQREILGAVPVPLADGRMVGGARGLVLVDGTSIRAEELVPLTPYGLRLVHPHAGDGAAADVLERLGAVRADPRNLLEDGGVRSAVQESLDADDSEALADAVLALVAAAVEAGHLAPGDLPWLADLALPDQDGELATAGGLVVPGSPAEDLLDADEFAPLAVEVVERWGTQVLEMVGVTRTLGLVTATDVDLAALPENAADLDDVRAWVADSLALYEWEVGASGSGGARGPGGIGMSGRVDELTAVRDLDVVRDDAWPQALRLLSGDRSLRAALVQPASVGEVGRPERGTVNVPSYTAWWIRQHVRVHGQRLTAFADPEAPADLADLLAEPPDWLESFDAEVRAALGLVRALGDLDPAGIRAILDRLADPDVEVAAGTMLALWAQFGDLDPAAAAVAGPSPEQVRVLSGTTTRVVDASDAVVVETPMWRQRTDLGGQVVAVGAAAETLAEMLDLPMASELAAGSVDDEGDPAEVPDVVRHLVPEAPDTWWEHDDLRVDGQEVDWWVDDDGHPHASTGDGLARALAWAADRWDQRHAVAVLLAEPDQAADLLVEAAYEVPRT